MKHIVTTDEVRLEFTAVDDRVYVNASELAATLEDQAVCGRVIFSLLPGDVERVLCALAAARLDSQLRDRGV